MLVREKRSIYFAIELVWGKSLTLCTRTRLCARANDAKIVRSRDAQCNTKESPLSPASSMTKLRKPTCKPVHRRKKINELFAGLGSVRIVKNCDLGLENAALGQSRSQSPRVLWSAPSDQRTRGLWERDWPSACGLGQHFQARGHSFSLCGPTLSRTITCLSSCGKLALIQAALFTQLCHWIGFTRRLQAIPKKINERTSEYLLDKERCIKEQIFFELLDVSCI